ncbi:type VI secretion system-associated protein TagF [Methylocella tundrae]|uniref:Type VI secretion system-associated protein TagF n=1 Tax=Methylocella tundrae TaxID=227605 RepID=A0A4U8Z2E0_METTU|nr:type VI secretion system-associated protein TagF [Methylocella tundrae]WPP03481.1 type VI secretion system-associated protein TagF [Methylocella tundrae]VFU09574.1 Type VI secretion system-associated protein TagF [Methylocella tundrae]
MRRGLIGKIASKPDYVAIEARGGLLPVLEPWLHAAVSSSRQRLGDAWRGAFLAAPIWRFWLGSEICGETILGALTPSIDSAGRYFPLVVFAGPPPGVAIPPPEFADNEVWFRAAEALLLSTLAPGALFDEALTALEGLPEPAVAPPVAARAPMLALKGGVLAPLDDKPPGQVFAWLRRADWARAYGARSFWQTAGGADFRPLALSFRLMPDPALFAAMLTGHFSGDAAGEVS